MKYALIIANTLYTDSGFAQLLAPGRDAEDLARVLRDKNIAAFDDVKVLLNQPESLVREAIDEFFDLKKSDDLLLLYFSGHGIRDEMGSFYLALQNTNRARLRATAIRSDFIRETMDQSYSKRQILILDCCNSGAFADGSKAAIGGSMGTSTAFKGSGFGRIILTASDATQFAWEGDRVIGETKNSLFTHYLIEGLEGWKADQDHDGKISIDDLFEYAYEQIVQRTPKQTPGKWSYKQQGEIVLRQLSEEQIAAKKAEEERLVLEKAEIERKARTENGLMALETADSGTDVKEIIVESFPKPGFIWSRTIIGSIIGVLLLTGVVLSSRNALPALFVEPTPTQTEMAIIVTATTMPTKTPTSTIIPSITPTALPTVMKVDWPVIVLDSFDNNDNGWDIGSSTSSLGTDSSSIVDGKFSLIIADANQNVLMGKKLLGFSPFFDFYLSVEASLVAGHPNSAFGLIFRESNMDYYRFTVQNNGTFYVEKKINKEWKDLISPQESLWIKSFGKNQLTVIAKGANFVFYINGNYVGEIVDEDFTSGSVGFFADLDADMVGTFEFDNFEIRAPLEDQ